jgi:aminopeptidase N
MPLTCDKVRSDGVFVFDKVSETLTFSDVASPPAASVFRGFSAPVKTSLDLSVADLLTLLRHDTDPFNRWQASQTVAMRLLTARARGEDLDPASAAAFSTALRSFVEREGLADPAFSALVLNLPAEADIAQEIGVDVDPDAIHDARMGLRRRIGQDCAQSLRGLHDELASNGVYSPDAASAGRRALRNVALDLLAGSDAQLGESLALRQFGTASNMTERLAALGVLTTLPGEAREGALEAFEQRFRNEPLVLDKWFTLQAAIPEAGTLDRVRRLMTHEAFSLANPNRARALLASFAMLNQTQFNRRDGAGYDFLAELIIRIDELNPQLAARLLTAFSVWKMMEKSRREAARSALVKIARKPNLSRDVGDIVQRSLNE